MEEREMIVEIEVTNYFCDKYHGDIKMDSEIFRVKRRFPWQKWTLLTEFGIGYCPGDKFDVFPVKVNRHYQVTFGDGFKDIKAKEIR